MSKKITICHVVFSFDAIGGLENGVINLVNGLNTNRFQHVICALTCCGDIQHRIEASNVTYIELHKKEGNDISLPFLLSRLFKQYKIDVVHLRNWPTMVEGFVGAKIAGIQRVIYSEHGRHFEEIVQKKFLKYHIKKYIFNHVSVLLTVSNEVKNEIRRLYKTKRDIRVIQNGVDHLRFRPIKKDSVRHRLGFKPSDAILGTVSRLVKGKNLHGLIHEFAQRCNEKTLLIIGDGPERRALEHLVQSLSLNERVKLLGNRNDIPELLNCLDIFLLPSLSEGLSNVVIEAMACGIPVGAFDTGGNLELIDHEKGGVLVPLNKMSELISLTFFILDNKNNAKTMGIYNRKKIEAEFVIDKMIRAYNHMYENLMIP